MRRTVLALLPAHNEAATITQAIASLQAQTSPPTHIVVVADNCTDETVELALAAGVEVFVTKDNQHKKAGGLNQALKLWLGRTRYVLVMDADSHLAPTFIATALRTFNTAKVGAVGGIFYGEDGNGLLGQFQRNEYGRYGHDINRRGGRAMVLTGTATMFRAGVLQKVAKRRGRRLPGTHGYVYDIAALTEDNEITIAIKSLGYWAVSPPQCLVTTEIMTSWRALWNQRLRWQRGALENLRHYGVSRTTAPYLFQQACIGFGVIALWAYVTYTALTLTTLTYQFHLFWFLIGAIFSVERLVTVWGVGWRGRALSLLILPELLFDIFIQAVFIKAVWDILRRKSPQWS